MLYFRELFHCKIEYLENIEYIHLNLKSFMDNIMQDLFAIIDCVCLEDLIGLISSAYVAVFLLYYLFMLKHLCDLYRVIGEWS